MAGSDLALGPRRGADEARAGQGGGPIVQELGGARVRGAEEHRPGLPALQQVLQPLLLGQRFVTGTARPARAEGGLSEARVAPVARSAAHVRTRREAAHVALGPPSVRLDDEARRLDGALGVAVRMAAAGQPDPEPLEHVLNPCLPRPDRAHVLEHAEPAVGTEDAADFGEATTRVRDAAEDEAAHHRVERRVAERERLGAAADEARAWRAPPRALEPRPGGIETDDPDALAIEGQVPPGPTPHVEREPARALDEPPPPPVEAQPLIQRAHRIVEPGDLLEATQRSGLREHDEGARVVVKEIPAADGRELAVSEEPDERKLAEVLPDQRHVVVGDAEEPLPTPRAVEVTAERGAAAAEAPRQGLERRGEVLARRFRVADLELNGLPHSHALGDGDRSARLVDPDEVAHEEIATLERRFRRIHREAGEDSGASDPRLALRQGPDRVAQDLERGPARDLLDHVPVGARHDVRLAARHTALRDADHRLEAREGNAGERAPRGVGRVELEHGLTRCDGADDGDEAERLVEPVVRRTACSSSWAGGPASLDTNTSARSACGAPLAARASSDASSAASSGAPPTASPDPAASTGRPTELRAGRRRCCSGAPARRRPRPT